MYWVVVLPLSFALTGVSWPGEPGLVGYWRFDDGAGAIAHDESGNGHHGTIVNATWETGQLGSALGFDGTAYVEVPAEAWASIEKHVTVAFWTYVHSSPPNEFTAFYASIDPADRYSRIAAAYLPFAGSIWWDTSGVLGGSWGGYDRINKGIQADEYLEAWHHWAFVKNAETGRQEIYLNGLLWHGGDGMTKLVKGAEVTRFTIGAMGRRGFLMAFYVGLMDDFQLYSIALTEQETREAMLGIAFELADSPAPGDGAQDVPREVILEWEPGESAATHNVYFGTSFDDVNDADTANALGVLVSQGQDANAFDPGGVLDFGQIYFWRVDEVNGAPDFTVFKGRIWSFTIEPHGRPITHITPTASSSQNDDVGPEKTVDGSGLSDGLHGVVETDMWMSVPGDLAPFIQYEFDKVYKLHEMVVWNSNQAIESFMGLGVKDVVIEHSLGGNEWTELEGPTRLSRPLACRIMRPIP